MSDSKISNRALLEYNRLGLIPGPEENEETFLKRVKQYKQPLQEKNRPTAEVEKALLLCKNFYDCAPSWVAIDYSNASLAFWHGAVTLIPHLENKDERTVIQLRKDFQKNSSYLGIYKKRELLAHEFAHISRMAFEETAFEEIFAYKLSDSSFRKWAGALIPSPLIGWFFLLLLFALSLLDVASIATGKFALFSSLIWLKLLPLLFLGGLGFHLFNKQRILKKLSKKIKPLLRNEDLIYPFLFRLTDNEIYTFATLSTKAILEYANKAKKQSLRWRLIVIAYLSDRDNDGIVA